MDTFIVIIIVGAAVVYCVNSFIKKYNGESSCNCSSGSCGLDQIHCAASINNMHDCIKQKNEQ